MDSVLKQLTNNFNELISREQLLRFLDQRCTQLFDRIIFEQLYSRMPKGMNGYVSVNDFKQIVLQAYQTLTTKIAQSSTLMDQKRNELNSISQKLKQLANTERYNNYNISLQSTLTIQILDGIVQFPGNSLVFIKIGCDEIIYQTKHANRNSPQWGDTFTFPIRTGQEEVWLAILDEESASNKQIGGQVQLQLQQFYDQKVHEEELSLMDQHNISKAAVVKVTVQWIHSQTKYLEQEILETQQQMQELKFDIDEYNNDIKAIFQPFQIESVGNPIEQSDSIQKHQQIANQLYSTQQNYSVEPPKQNTEITPNQWLRISLILTLMFFVSAIAESFIRTQYLDFLILFYSLWFYMNNSELHSLLHIKIMAFMYILSIVYDGFWMFFYFKPYLKNEVKFDHQEDTFHQYTVVLCILILIEKLFIILSYFNLYVKCPNARQNIFDEQYEICFGSYYQQKLAESQKQAQYSSKVIRQGTPNVKYIYPMQQQSQSQRQRYSLRYVQ
ncbi:unnamed protein product (macronuclear) [Paramecium tetraurelia]|uniref:C2 domain-containing protein n=1 Tax=Paramecium tetraurelia TaxID=5888 RepID=A0CFD4_PARTE|nr:uncharacterized protein GSPATT00037940001 [Paramecium tetraurelia]CAK69501.1 unnamed protein product [Paramecium tetraurelia]|eukprot:XP_001436898.1 hypothetical protein (macronuclear) [Paramecium tetraurelia strain d4-2]